MHKTLLDTDISAALAGRIYANLERAGQPIGRADPMVAAIALRYNMVLATGNLRHYQRIQEVGYRLQLDNWKMEMETRAYTSPCSRCSLERSRCCNRWSIPPGRFRFRYSG